MLSIVAWLLPDVCLCKRTKTVDSIHEELRKRPSKDASTATGSLADERER